MICRAHSLPRSLLQPASLRAHFLNYGRSISTVRCVELFGPARAGPSYEDREIQVNGIVRSVRRQKKYAFAHISDGSTERPLQAILSPQQAEQLATGAAVEISGTWKASPAKGQSHELQATHVEVVGDVDPKTYPIQKKYHTPEFLRSIPHLRVRTPFNSLLSRFRADVTSAVSDFFQHRHEYGPFYQVHPPLITSSDCEGAGEVFTLAPKEVGDKNEQFFREPKYLTVSSQLHLEAYAAELGSVWTLSPTFRAERSDTPRHLAEFYMLEVEVNHVRQLGDIMILAEDMIKHIVGELRRSSAGMEMLEVKRTVLEDRPGQPSQETEDTSVNLAERWNSLTQASRWERISYTKAMEHLVEVAKSSNFQYKPSWSAGLQLEHERHLVEAFGKGGPLFVTDYPQAIKPFYMLPSDAHATSDTATVANFDLLFPHVAELIGGSLREHRLPQLLSNMRRQGLLREKEVKEGEPTGEIPSYPGLQPQESLGSLEWYADLRRYGSAPHGGFGLGFDRLLAYLTGVSHLRDVVGFPRYWGRADC